MLPSGAVFDPDALSISAFLVSRKMIYKLGSMHKKI
jgi:hypothetical protein